MFSLEKKSKFLSERNETLLHSVNSSTHLVVASSQAARRASIVLVTLIQSKEQNNMNEKSNNKSNKKNVAKNGDVTEQWNKLWSPNNINFKMSRDNENLTSKQYEPYFSPEDLNSDDTNDYNYMESDTSSTISNTSTLSLHTVANSKKKSLTVSKQNIFVCEPNVHLGYYSASLSQQGNILLLSREVFDPILQTRSYESTFILLDQSKKGDLVSESSEAISRGCKYVSAKKHHLQFIHDDTRNTNYYYIRFTAGESIRTLEIKPSVERRNGLNIKQHEGLYTLVSNGFFWSSWNNEHKLLYSLELNTKSNSSSYRICERNPKELRIDCVLKCFDLSSLVKTSQVKSKNRFQFEYTLTISIARSAIPAFDNYRKEGWDNIRSYSHKDVNIHLLHLGNNSICLCQQHLLNHIPAHSDNTNDIWGISTSSFEDEVIEGQYIIPISIFSINHKKEIRIDIPISHSQLQMSSSRSNDDLSNLTPVAPNVLFSSYNGLLIIFLPGVYMEVIDLHPQHDPWSIAQFTDPEKLHVLHQGRGQYFLNELSVIQSNDCVSHLFIPSQGYLYEWKFSKEFILNEYIPELCSLENSLTLIHMILSHIPRDIEFIRTVLVGMSKKHLFLGEVFAEFLVEMAFISVSENVEEMTFLQLIPTSLLEKYLTTTLDVRNLSGSLTEAAPRLTRRKPIIYLLEHIPVIHGNDIEIQRKLYEMYQRQSSKAPLKQNQSYFKGFQFFQFFTSQKKDEEFFKAPQVPTDPICHVLMETFQQNVLNTLTKYAPSKIAERIPKLAIDYCTFINLNSSWLFSLLTEYSGVSMSTRPSKSLFILYQGFHQCLELTGFPPPSTFCEKFAIAGIKVLPRKLFIDYVHRDVFWITDKVVKELHDASMAGFPSDEYLGIVIRKLHHKKSELRHFEDMKDGISQILSYYANKLPVPKEFTYSFMVETDNFIGLGSLDYLMHSWRNLEEQIEIDAPSTSSAIKFKVNYLKNHCTVELNKGIKELEAEK